MTAALKNLDQSVFPRPANLGTSRSERPFVFFDLQAGTEGSLRAYSDRVRTFSADIHITQNPENILHCRKAAVSAN